MKKRELIISLIKDDMINTKLVENLNNAGLEPGDYYLNLSGIIMKLMGFERYIELEELLYEEYIRRTQAVLEIDINQDHIKLDALAQEIYLWLRSHQKRFRKGVWMF